MTTTPLPSKEQADQAYSFMVDKVHVPAFFEKLAANGMEPQTEAEAQQLLELGAVLAQAKTEGQVKQAEEGNPFLNHVMARAKPVQKPNVDALVKQSADRLVSSSDLARTAALVYAHAQTGGELAETEQS
jgi:hypothetical protein